jgi:hypothetical protein
MTQFIEMCRNPEMYPLLNERESDEILMGYPLPSTPKSIEAQWNPRGTRFKLNTNP